MLLTIVSHKYETKMKFILLFKIFIYFITLYSEIYFDKYFKSFEI